MSYEVIRTKFQVWDVVLNEPVVAEVSVVPSVSPIKDTASGYRLLTEHHTIRLDNNGWFEADLAASDDPNLLPSGFSYVFTVKSRSTTYEFESQVRLADATSVTETLDGVDYTHWELDLSALAPVLPDIPLSEAEAIRNEMIVLRDDSSDAATAAELARDGAVAVGTTNDTIMASRTNDPTSAFRVALTRSGNKPVAQGELVFNVMDFGAVGDGATNDSAAFQAAMKAAAADAAFGPAVAWVPWTPKGYRIDAGLSIPSRVTLRGDRRVRLRRTGSGSALFINSNAARGWTVENLTLDDSLGLSTTAVIRNSTGSRDYTIRNCKFVGGALGVSRAVVSKQIASNVATITTDEPHELEVGSLIHLSQIDSTFSGDFTVTAKTATSVSFSLVAANVNKVGVGGEILPVSVYDGWLNGETRRTVISKASAPNPDPTKPGTSLITLETSQPHGYVTNQCVYVTGVEGENDGGLLGTMNGLAQILSYDATHITYLPVNLNHDHANVAPGTPSGGTIGHDTRSLNSSVGSNGHAIEHQNGIVGGLIEENWFEGFANNIRIPDVRQLTVRNNLFTNWTTRALYVVGQVASATEDLWLVGNKIKDMHIGGEIRQAIAFQGANDSNPHKRTLIAFNTVIGVNKSWTHPDPGGSDQISLQRCEDFRVVGNYSGFGGDLGFNASSQCRRGLFANNVAEHNDTAGINIGAQASTYCRDIALVGNTLINNGQNRSGDRGQRLAISLAGFAQRILITGNILSDDQAVPTTTCGIYGRNASDIEIGNNLISLSIANKYDFTTWASTNTNIRGLPLTTNTITTSTPASVAGNNNSSDVSMWNAATVPATALAVGQQYRLRVHGNADFVTGSGLPGAFNLRLRVGSSILFTVTIVASGTTLAATAVPWMIDVDLIVEALGTSGKLSVVGQFLRVTGNTNTPSPIGVQDIGTTRDLSAGLDVSVTASTAVANPGNIIRTLRASLIKIA